MPYLKVNIKTNNVFFWAIGYLGDTVSAIDPNTGTLNVDVQHTLKPYFGEVTPNGVLQVDFVSNTAMQGDLNVNVSSNTLSQSYVCNIANGCQFQLAENNYTVEIPKVYRVNEDEKALYQIESAPKAIQITKNQTNQLQLPLTISIAQQLAEHSIKGTLTLKDEAGQILSKSLAEPLILKLTAKDDLSEVKQCTFQADSCQVSLFNTLVDESGQFSNRSYELSFPEKIKDMEGAEYQLKAPLNLTEVNLIGNQPETIDIALEYRGVPKSNPDNGGQNGACVANLSVSNFWQSGAVIQGTVTNNSANPIRHFVVTVNIDPNSAQNVSLVNAWVGGNMNTSSNGNQLVLSADTWDQYNGLQQGQSQGVGFQIQANLNGAPQIQSIQCE